MKKQGIGELKGEDIRHEKEIENESEGEFMKPQIQKKTFTVQGVINYLGFGFFQIFIVIFCGILFMSESSEIMLLTNLTPILKEKWNLSSFSTGLIASCVFGGMCIGSFVWGLIGDKFGRKITIWIITVIFVVFAFSSAFCTNFYFFLATRVIVGVACGGGSVPFSLFTEYLPTKSRGIWLLTIEMFWCIGSVYEAGMGWLILENDDFFKGRAWQYYVGVSCIPSFFLFCFVPFLPESLRFYSIKGNHKKIIKIIKKMDKLSIYKKLPYQFQLEIGGKIYDYQTGKEEKPINDTQNQIGNEKENVSINQHQNNEEDKKKKKEKSQLMLILTNWKLMFIMINISLILVGATLTYYGVSLSTPEFFPDDYKYVGVFVSSFAEFVGIVVSAIFLNIIGRKLTQGICFFIASICLILLIIPYHNIVYDAIVSFILRAAIMGASCIIWILANESLPTNIRTTGFGISQAVGKISNIFTPILCSTLQFWNYLIPKIIFCVAGFISGLLSLLHPYETKGKDLVDDMNAENTKKREILRIEKEKPSKERIDPNSIKEFERLD